MKRKLLTEKEKMIITIIRHGKVDHTWKKSCTSAEFDEECRLYDSAPLEDMRGVEKCKANKVYISTLDRSFQTAKILFGDMPFCRTEKINEVPLRSAFDTGLRMPLWFWNVTGRLQWLCNSRRQPETKRQTRDRAEDFAKELLQSGEDCTLVTHGFFMHTLISVLKRHGFRADASSIHYKNAEAIVLQKKGA